MCCVGVCSSGSCWAPLVDADTVEFGVEHKGGGEFLIAHFGPSAGEDKSDGEPGIRTLALNPHRFLLLAARRLSTFLTSLLRAAYKRKEVLDPCELVTDAKEVDVVLYCHYHYDHFHLSCNDSPVPTISLSLYLSVASYVDHTATIQDCKLS